MARVILDAGHGGRDTGDIYRNHNERKDNLKLALRIGQILKDKNIDAEFTRREDIYLSRMDRVKIANNLRGDLFVSIHRLFGSAFRIGPDLNFLVPEEKGLGYEAAKNIGHRLMDIGFQKIEIRRTDTPILKDVAMPSLTLEIGFLKKDKVSWFHDGYFEEIASAVADGISKTITGVMKVSAVSVSECPSCGNAAKGKDFKMSDYRFKVQVGTFRDYNSAFLLQIQLFDQGYHADIMKKSNLYAVLVGDYENIDKAAVAEKAFQRSGYNSMMIAIKIKKD